MDMEFGWWILLLPLLVAFILYYLFFFVIGSRFLKTGFKARKAVLVFIGIGVMTAPFTIQKIRDFKAQQKANDVYEYLASLERTSLEGRLPRKYVTVGSFTNANIKLIQNQYGLRPFPEAENNRLKAAYRNYRKAEFCHKYTYDRVAAYREKFQPRNKLPICRPLPDSLQDALNIKQPVLFFVEGSSTSYRRSNVMIGKKYEIRLVTPREDLLVEYFEEREIDSPAGVTNPLSSGRKLDSRKLDKQEPTPTQQEFIQNALENASR